MTAFGRQLVKLAERMAGSAFGDDFKVVDYNRFDGSGVGELFDLLPSWGLNTGYCVGDRLDNLPRFAGGESTHGRELVFQKLPVAVCADSSVQSDGFKHV